MKVLDFEYLGYAERDTGPEAELEQFLVQKHSTHLQNQFIQNKRQKLETEMIGFQGKDGSKIAGDTVQVSEMSGSEFRNLFSLILEP